MTDKWKKVLEYDTEYPADSVEFCPIEPHHDILVCGTYQKEETQRVGRILLFEVSKTINHLQTIDTAAILDMKWHQKRVNGRATLAVASSQGEVCVFELESRQLLLVAKCSLNEDGAKDYLALSLDWGPSDTLQICVSDSKGFCSILNYSGRELVLHEKWLSHSLEAWIVGFDAWDPAVLYSGGDDIKFKVWDVRVSKETAQLTSRAHTAGVTCLHSSRLHQYTLATGSYDERVLLWDTRAMKRPRGEVGAGGGLWRLKWEPRSGSKFLLTASIYGGFQIIDSDTLTVIDDYQEHSSLAYGADWSVSRTVFSDWKAAALIATCSFYDHKLTISVWDGAKLGD